MFKKKKDKKGKEEPDEQQVTVVETHADVNITTEVPIDPPEDDNDVSNEELIESELGGRDDEEVADLPTSAEDIKGAFKGMAKSLKRDVKDGVKGDTGLHPEGRLIISKTLDFWVPTFLAIFSVYVLGYFGFHFLYAGLVLAGLYAFDAKRQERMWRRRFREMERQRKRETTEISSDPTKETVVWMNTILEKFWPKVAPWAERLILIKAKESIENALKKSKPAIVDTVEMPDLRLGTTPIQIEYMKTHQTDEGVYKLDVHFAYAGEIKVVIKPVLNLAIARASLPIIIEDLEISAGLHLELDLIRGYLPFVKTLHLSFSEPKIDLSLRPLKSGILDLPIIHSWITNTIANVLLDLDIHHHFIEGIDDAELERKAKSKNALASGASAIGGGVKTIGKGIGTGITTIGKGTVTGVTTVGKGIGTGVSTVGKGAVSGVTFIGKGTATGVTTMGKGIGKGFKKLNPLKGSKSVEEDEDADEEISAELTEEGNETK
eukprot:TRINITY_DN11094_c0_g1_i1.p1 TRINITY_DN11094_c0_g1~~TRINITY_DN11094_c0_g1_i1.p1  ORF type:complete len:491 (+),score=160.21 TRINITY_DN11094_c0_g1_i1:107-1579(+)